MVADDPTRRGHTLGTVHGATLGTADGSTLGPQRADRYRARITTGDGRRTDVKAVISADIQYEHTDVSDVSLEVPRVSGLGAFRFGDLDVFYGSRLLFQATLEKFPGPGTGETAELYGRGPARTLARNDISVSFGDVEIWQAIKQVWGATRFDATVIKPQNPTTLTEYSNSGTQLEVLQDLHDRAGMRFTAQHTQPSYVVESYVPGEVVRAADWTSIEHDSSGDVTDYANAVTVNGGRKPDGSQAQATAEDQAEINRVGRQPITVTEPDATTDAQADDVAQSELADRLENDTFSGSLEIIPEVVLPGYYRTVPEWDTGDGPPTLSVDSVSLSEGPGEASGTVTINAPDGVTDVLQQQQREISRLKRPDQTVATGEDTLTGTVDSFESGNLDPYTGGADAGKSAFAVVDDSTLPFNAREGTHVLESPGGSDGEIYSLNGDGLDNYFAKGSIARCWLRWGDTPYYEHRLYFGFASTQDNYLCRLMPDRPTLQLGVEDGGSYDILSTDGSWTQSLQAGTWYQLYVKWDDGTLGGANNEITVRLEDESGAAIASTTAIDGTHADETGVAFRSYNTAAGQSLYWDYLRLVSQNDTGDASGTLVTSFEGQDLTASFQGVNAEMNQFTTTALDGDAAHDPSGEDFDAIYSLPGDGLNAYFGKGERIEVHCRLTAPDPGRWAFLFGTADQNNTYRINLGADINDFKLQKVDGGSVSDLDGDYSVGYPSETWLRVTVTWGDGATFGLQDNEIQCEVVNTDTGETVADTVSAVDGTFAGNDGVGLYWLQNASSEGILTDYWVLR